MIRFIIKAEPRTKKNSQKLIMVKGRPMIIPSKQFTEYQNIAGWFVPKNQKIDYPVNIRCIFYMKTKRKCDLTNLLEAIDDVLVHYGVIADDNYSIVAAHDGSRVFVDKDNPRTEVFIEELSDGKKTDGASEVLTG